MDNTGEIKDAQRILIWSNISTTPNEISCTNNAPYKPIQSAHKQTRAKDNSLRKGHAVIVSAAGEVEMSHVAKWAMVATLLVVPLYSASVPMQVIAVPAASAAGNSEAAHLVVRLANLDGSPKSRAGLQPAVQGWKVKLLWRPAAFDRTSVPVNEQDQFGTRKVVQEPARSEFQVTAITEVDPGVYDVAIVPAVFYSTGGRVLSAATPWVAGEYVVRVSYSQGPELGDTLVTLIVK